MAHAFFSPSGSNRWRNCTGSLTLSRYAPPGSDGDNKHSVEGTAAHALSEHCINAQIEPFHLLDYKTFDDVAGYPVKKLKELGISEEIWAKREKTVQDVSHFVNEAFALMDAGYTIYSEMKLKLDGFDGRCWGTGDLVAWNEVTKHLVIMDYKNGVNYVSEASGQLIIYGVGACDTLRIEPAVITTIVVQPNAPGDPVRRKEWTLGSLGQAFEPYDVVMEAYLKSQLQDVKAGEWCRYCRAKTICHEFQSNADDQSDAKDDASIKSALARIPAIKLWMKDIEKRAFARLMQGANPRTIGALLNVSKPNRKLRDAIPDDDGNLITLVDAVKEEFGDLAFSKPEIKSPAQLEKLPGGKAFAQKWAYNPTGTLVLAGLDSKKPHVTPQSTKDRLATVAGVESS